jgi:DNA repair protein RecN (Recombination protein N)
VLRRLALRDFVIVPSLEVDLEPGFTVLTGETGAGKSILIDALQLALGSRGDVGVVREGATRAEIVAEFDAPESLAPWLADGGFDGGPDDGRLLVRRTIDAQGKSRAWINGSAATVAQLRDAADHLVEIHGQHAWQNLTRPPAVRALLDAFAGLPAQALAAPWQRWRAAGEALEAARTRHAELERERDRLAWQIGEIEKLDPGDGEWEQLDAEHRRLANAQALIDAMRSALAALDDAEDSAAAQLARAAGALDDVAAYDADLAAIGETLAAAQAQIADAARDLASTLHRTEPEPDRLAELDARLSAWLGAARRWRRPPAELPALRAEWRAELQALEAAADLDALTAAEAAARAAFEAAAKQVSKARAAAAPKLAEAVTQAMQSLGMAGGRFEVALVTQDPPQTFGNETVELLVAGHAGALPRPLARVASGGELSRIALAIAVTTSRLREAGAGTLIFDEVDAGVGGAVAESVGALMKQLGRDRQVLAVTHLPQVAACADRHLVVSKKAAGSGVASDVQPVAGEARVAEIARMLAGERLSGTSLAHAQELLAVGAGSTPGKRGRK